MKKRVFRDLTVLALIFLGVSIWQTRDLVASGEPAPALTAPRLEGETFSLETQRGKTVLLYFFAPWCSVCKVSASNALWIRKIVSPSRLEVAAVALDYESEASIVEFVKDAGIEALPVVRGTDDIRDRFKITAYPTFYIIDAEGRVHTKGVGYSTLVGMLIRALLA